MEQLLGLASNPALATKSRHAAADVLCMWGCGWHAERLLWLAIAKATPPSAMRRSAAECEAACPAALLQPSMIRHIMRFYVMTGACELPEL